ncbi:putative 3'-nucleotidase/nuclease [Leishmania major strain Friedlin]|uniref:Putative 3'-nucleotidase/nuclease n=1 Tax=Leishmania major TaxID=5664 RepID=Q4QGQ3_LEIMA|nr:putative 3'-nucleotidase/nuclease [Leishmania major strain Friedlin]CAG9570446.1 3'-nucleotidase/nuclease_-_putative [Leishmania major strain Friedlin]CAJ02560.1 putative 3'-nucleotidase/nuclease [Leishmania major strain Friedlin]|eukprot:XP_001681645.1 putative 3'-nucleotidase/nuclease [Leishmania major strain Friedlin]
MAALAFSAPALRAAVVAMLLLLALPTQAWWDKGHMCIAEIARRNLKPDVQAKVQACANALNKIGPFPKSTNIVELGPWADDLKSMGLYTMSTWHFIDTIYNPQDVKVTINPVEIVNVASVIPMLISAITSPTATSDIIITSVANLIHFVGDIHMPLHSADLFSPEYPLGDLGGNKQIVIVNETAGTSMKLHAFWDSMCEGPQNNAVRPLDKDAYAELSAFVDNLVKSHSFTEEQMMMTNSTIMAAESYELAVKNVYPGISDGTVLSESYKANGKILAAGRVTLAGYRLATILNTALAGVSLDTIINGTKHMQDEVEVTHTGDTYNYYAFSGVERGAAAGIFLSSFVIGCLLATAVVLAVLYMRRGSSKDERAAAASANHRI